MRKRKLTLLEWTMVAAPAVVLAVVFLPKWMAHPDGKDFRLDVVWTDLQYKLPWHARETHCGPTCQSNLKQIGLGMLQYRQDYDGRFPLVAVSSAPIYGWADALQPYLKSLQMFHCPQIGGVSNGNPARAGYTDYWYNSNLSGVTETALSRSTLTNTFMLGDGNDGRDITDARYSKSSLPSRWLMEHGNPPRRHLTYQMWAEGGANYAFIDGHVKWLKPNQISGTPSQQYTFAIK